MLRTLRRPDFVPLSPLNFTSGPRDVVETFVTAADRLRCTQDKLSLSTYATVFFIPYDVIEIRQRTKWLHDAIGSALAVGG